MKPAPSRTPLRRPVCPALVICDAVHRDPGNRKAFLLGSFNTLVGNRFPHQAPPCVVHYAVGDGQGDYEIKLVVEEEATGRMVVTVTKAQLRIKSPIQTVEDEIPVPSIRYLRPGRYWFKLYADNTMIGQRAIVLGVSNRKP